MLRWTRNGREEGVAGIRQVHPLAGRHPLARREDNRFVRLFLKKNKLQSSALDVVRTICAARTFARQADASDIDNIARATGNLAAFRLHLLQSVQTLEHVVLVEGTGKLRILRRDFHKCGDMRVPHEQDGFRPVQ